MHGLYDPECNKTLNGSENKRRCEGGRGPSKGAPYLSNDHQPDGDVNQQRVPLEGLVDSRSSFPSS